MIFISHNHKDKGIVEPIALNLRNAFGQENVFYDSWSMQPGDGIIDKMNEGLENCKLFLFFVSKNSLQSNMVKLEWQNAVFKVVNSNIKLIPVRIDNCLIPSILMQTLYIDLFTNGLDVATRQIRDILAGKNIFRPENISFSNLKAYYYQKGDSIFVECHAEHFLEPKTSFLYLFHNEQSEISIKCESHSHYRNAFINKLPTTNGGIYKAQMMAVDSGTLPGFPFIIKISPIGSSIIHFKGVMHEIKRNEWKEIPLVEGEYIDN